MLYNKYIKYKEKYILQKNGGSISSSNKSLFVLSCGPTGSTDSGKSNVKKIFECIYNKKFNEILVDDLVENDPLYLSIISTINLHYDLDSIIEKLNQIKLALEDNPSLIKNYEKIFIELKKNKYYCNTLLHKFLIDVLTGNTRNLMVGIMYFLLLLIYFFGNYNFGKITKTTNYTTHTFMDFILSPTLIPITSFFPSFVFSVMNAVLGSIN
jgi:energy-coupling factor transporter ATP-binding protein EcfA2